MNTSFQQESLIRKLVYFGFIVVLFFATLLLRKDFVVARAEELGLREKNQGEVELTGAALRLSLTGSRGLVVCVLWVMAQDKQSHHEWNELELIIRTLTKLQPHFITPWLFQTWDLAYNVSVEADRIKDEYFYISRGIDLLAEGEKQNQDNPDIRQHMGFYYQSKFGLSDHTNTLRSLLQMSCIDPLERNPARFRPNPKDRHEVDLSELEQFCRGHPFLVRRLHDSLGCKTPRELIDFLETNQRIPSRFEDKPNAAGGGGTPLKPEAERFPILPPQRPKPPLDNEYTNTSEMGDDFDSFMAARAWFSYAQDPVEPPLARIPRQMALAVFQQYPARAQAYLAERLEKEGWFDEDLWPITDWFPKRTVYLGDPRRNWAGEAWQRTYEMLRDHGVRHNVLRTPEELQAMAKDSPEYKQYEANRIITNFAHWFTRADVERTNEGVDARKRFFEAEQSRLSADPPSLVLKKYEDKDAFGEPGTWKDPQKRSGWTKIFFDRPDFRNDSGLQEEAYELELKYLDVVQKVKGPQVRRRMTLEAAAAGMGVLPGQAALWTPVVERENNALPLPPFPGPFDGVDKEGNSYISADTVRVVRGWRGETVSSESSSSGQVKAGAKGS